MSGSSLPELVRDFPQALGDGTAKALLSGGGPEKGKEPAWHPGVQVYLRVSGVLRNLARVCLWVFVICVVRVSDVCSVCVVCVFGVQYVCVYLVYVWGDCMSAYVGVCVCVCVVEHVYIYFSEERVH